MGRVTVILYHILWKIKMFQTTNQIGLWLIYGIFMGYAHYYQNRVTLW